MVRARDNSVKMVEKQGKRAGAATTPRRNVRRRIYMEVPDLTHVTFAPLEDMMIDVHLKSKVAPDLKLADIYAFLKFSVKLPALDIALVNEFLQNYNINDGSSIVKGRRILIVESLLKKALYLPVSELSVGDAKPPPDYNPAQYFRTGMDALDNKQGWKIGEAITPDLMDWMRIAQKRLVLGRHGTYLAQKYLYAVTQTFNGMVFNWAAFVVERIYQELESKRKTGKIATLLGASYISLAVKYQLDQPLTESDQELEAERNRPEKEKDDATPSVPREPACRTRAQQQQVQKNKTVVTEVGSPSVKRKQTDQQRRSPSPRQEPEVYSVEEEAEKEEGVADALQQASREPGTLKDHIVVGLEQLLDWVKRQTEPNYPALMAEFKDLQEQAQGLRADCVMMSKAVTELRTQKEAAVKEKDYQAAEAKRERDRHQIAYQNWQDEKKALEDRIKEKDLEHQRIKDDLDNALLKALNESVELHEALRDREFRLEQLEKAKKAKSVVCVAVQTEPEEGGTDQDSAKLRQTIKLLEKQVRDLGEYNEELREKYEPEEDEAEGDKEEEDPDFVRLDKEPRGKERYVGESSTAMAPTEMQAEVPPTEIVASVVTPTDATEVGGAITGSELAEVADSVVVEQVVQQAVIEQPAEEAVELVVVQAVDSVFEVVLRNCEDAIQ